MSKMKLYGGYSRAAKKSGAAVAGEKKKKRKRTAVDRIISVESCMLGVEPDGTVFTAKGRNEQIDVRRISLDDVLLCTMPRVTYTEQDAGKPA